MKKKMFTTLLTVAFAMSLSACASSNTEEKTTDSTEETTAETEDTAATEGSDSYLAQRVAEKGYISIGTGNDVPFAFVDESTGEATGIDVDIVKEALGRMGITNIEWKVMDWSVLMEELSNGTSIDMIADGVIYKDERAEVVDFSNPVYLEGECLVVSPDSDIKSKADLKGKKVGTVIGWAYDGLLDTWLENGEIGEKFIFSNQTDAILALTQGSIDAALIDGVGAPYLLKQNPDIGYKIVEDYEPECLQYSCEQFAFGNADFLDEFNDVIDEMKNDGTMKEILTNWGLADSFNLEPAEDYQYENSGLIYEN